MKSISLTEQQKEKLLEMCKVLFPEFYEICFNLDFLSFEGNNAEDNPNLLLFYKQGENAIEIHWFEFCFTNLTKKINDLYHEKNSNDLAIENTWTESPYRKIWSILNLGSIKQHPVDYLFEQFKLLQK